MAKTNARKSRPNESKIEKGKQPKNPSKKDGTSSKVDKLKVEEEPVEAPSVSVRASNRERNAMLSLVFSSIKCAMTVQTVWRLPRTIISSSGPEGCLVFVILYTVFSFVWALPTLVLEGGIGRWNRKGVVNSFHEFIDTRATWCGVWIMACSFFTAGYLNVVVGWCLYFLYSSVVRPLPRTLNETEIIFDNFVTKEWKWNVFNSFVVCLCVVSSLIKGIWIIEMINTILAPIFIVLVVGIFALSAVNMTAMLDAMIFLFTPDITVATLPRVWWNAISQSSCASGAGYGVMLTYAIHQPRDFSIVKNSVGVIACVLITSLFIALTPLIAQFGERMNANVTAKMVIEQLRESDTSDLGLMFTSNYILLGKTGTVGRGVAMLFFTCLLCAGLRTLVGLGEVSVRVLIEAGVSKTKGAVGFVTGIFVLSIVSAKYLQILRIQDVTWTYGLIISGLLTYLLVLAYGPSTFRTLVLNFVGVQDIQLPLVFNYLFHVPVLLALASILFLLMSDQPLRFRLDFTDHQHTGNTFVQWGVVLGVVIVVNVVLVVLKGRLYYCNVRIYNNARLCGSWTKWLNCFRCWKGTGEMDDQEAVYGRVQNTSSHTSTNKNVSSLLPDGSTTDINFTAHRTSPGTTVYRRVSLTVPAQDNPDYKSVRRGTDVSGGSENVFAGTRPSESMGTRESASSWYRRKSTSDSAQNNAIAVATKPPADKTKKMSPTKKRKRRKSMISKQVNRSDVRI